MYKQGFLGMKLKRKKTIHNIILPKWGGGGMFHPVHRPKVVSRQSGNSLSTWSGSFLLTWSVRNKSSSSSFLPSSPSYRPPNLSHLPKSWQPRFPTRFPWNQASKFSPLYLWSVSSLFRHSFSRIWTKHQESGEKPWQPFGVGEPCFLPHKSCGRILR